MLYTVANHILEPGLVVCKRSISLGESGKGRRVQRFIPLSENNPPLAEDGRIFRAYPEFQRPGDPSALFLQGTMGILTALHLVRIITRSAAPIGTRDGWVRRYSGSPQELSWGRGSHSLDGRERLWRDSLFVFQDGDSVLVHVQSALSEEDLEVVVCENGKIAILPFTHIRRQMEVR
ncbi:hypothetical protein EPN83_00445 [Patescibacteria group bacterium]|nr:MAG: hypothetical protein EPN83_00445 [Patescibacteria group bacterium]